MKSYPKPRKRSARLALICICAAPAVMLTTCGQNSNAQNAQANPDPDKSGNTAFAIAERQPPQNSNQIITSFAPVVRNAAPAVVNIYSSRTTQTSPFANHPFFERFFGERGFGMPRERVSASLGSGVIVGDDGIIVTNNHVVENAQQLRVILTDRREFIAQPILADKRADLAVLKIDAGDEVFPTLDFADTRALEVGDLVLAIGNPFGVGQTVTSGIVSALARTDVGVSDYAFFIQTDAAINPGNSGGALVDVHGRLVGVNTAIFSRSGGSNGIGFAIPAEMVKRVVDSATSGGYVERPWLGLKAQAVNAALSRSLGLEKPAGVLITDIYPNGPAHRAGLKRGDLITAVNDREVFDYKGLRFLVATRSPRETITLDVISDNQHRAVPVKLDTPPAADQGPTLISGSHPFNGVTISDLSPSLAEDLGLDPFSGGVVVVSIPANSAARNIGLQRGDVLRSVNGINVSSSQDLQNLLGGLPAQLRSWKLSFERNGQLYKLNARL